MDRELQAAFDTLRQHVDGRIDEVDRSLGVLAGRVDGLDQRFDQVDRRLDQVDQRFDQIERRLDGVDRRGDGVDRRLDGLGQHAVGVDGRLDRFEAAFIDLRQHVDTTAAETRGHFDVVAEGIRGDIRLLAEGFTRIDRVEIALRDDLARSHDALATLIRLTDTDLDRRVKILERRPPDSD